MANPYESPTSKGPNRYGNRSVPMLDLAAWLYPAVLIGSFYATWLVAWFALGHMPRPSLDDPKSIGILVDIPYMLTGILLIAFPAAAIVGIAFQLYASNRTRPKRLIGSALLAARWVVAILILRWDPMLVTEWYMD